MPIILSSATLDRMLAAPAYEDLVWIAGILAGCSRYDPEAPTYGLPEVAFGLVERLTWFAQGVRSGVWTYFEATPLPCQNAMLAILKADAAHPEFRQAYEIGMRDWRTPSALTAVDAWMDANDDRNTRILWDLVAANRTLLQGLVNTA
ncbi:hypothetical protein [Methylobacterium sp. Leaf100]|uniref:hypothetical protein n=1 Tax=Methylobacterium sp. Leaf100 TaxID=1736252 RepID=UPI0006FC6280|nr:hypothetical protein [Methylobacterium sp. Leaf100]KQP34994.1 hypothetical protein ASF25_14120 [Methylobacterium sp. Leaf100]